MNLGCRDSRVYGLGSKFRVLRRLKASGARGFGLRFRLWDFEFWGVVFRACMLEPPKYS